MEIRIGVTQSPRDIEIEVDDGTDREALRTQVSAALAGEVSVLWLTDRKGREVAVAAEKIAFVEIGHPEQQRSMGFGV